MKMYPLSCRKKRSGSLRVLLPELVTMLQARKLSSSMMVPTMIHWRYARNSGASGQPPIPEGQCAAVKSGRVAANGAVLIFMDADGQHKLKIFCVDG